MIISRLLKHHFTSILITLLISLQMSACSTEEDSAAASADNIDSDTIINTDTSTNSPAVISGDDARGITEDVGAAHDNLLEQDGKLNITDSDAGEAAFIATTINGSYGSLTIDVAGNWYYAAINSQAVIQDLNSGETLTDSLTVSSVDGTTHNVVITIVGADEIITPTNSPAAISGVDSGSVTEDIDPDGDNQLEVGGKLNITDSDSGEAAFIAKTVNGNYGSLTIDAVGNWNYAASNSQTVIQNLATGATLTDSLTISSIDGTTHNVVITIVGVDEIITPTNSPAVISGVDIGNVTEDIDPDTDGLLEVGDKLNITDSDAGEAAFIAKTVNASYGNLTIDAAGNWNYAAINSQAVIQDLANGTTLTDSLTVSSVDGTTHSVTITIKGADEANTLADINLSWVAPSEREDNTAISLSEIAGYKIYYGATQGQYPSSVDINDSSATAYTFTGFTAGTYYFTVTTIDTDGRESQYSSEVIIII